MGRAHDLAAYSIGAMELPSGGKKRFGLVSQEALLTLYREPHNPKNDFPLQGF